MKNPILTKFKNLLQTQREEISAYIQNHAPDLDHHGDETDAIQAKILERSNAQLLARNQNKLLKIDLALKKVADGTYGDCESCGEPIAEKRLIFNPVFNTCVACAESLEVLKKNIAR